MPVRNAIASAVSKNAAIQASRCGMGKPAPAISAAVASMPVKANLKLAAMAKTKAKIRRATRIAAVFIGKVLCLADERELGALRVDPNHDMVPARDFHRAHDDL